MSYCNGRGVAIRCGVGGDVVHYTLLNKSAVIKGLSSFKSYVSELYKLMLRNIVLHYTDQNILDIIR